MRKQRLYINNIPAILWGDPSDNLFIAVHGDQSNKEDDVIEIFSEEISSRGGQVLSFDLPEHGDRKTEGTLCKVQNCVGDLKRVREYAYSLSKSVSLFAVSIGAYFGFLAYKDEPLEQALLLSPVIDMESILVNLMEAFDVSEERLEKEKEIATPVKTLYWDYYTYVKSHPIDKWISKTAILYGENDTLSSLDLISEFSTKFGCDLTVMPKGEHYFHTEEQLAFFKQWLAKSTL